MIFVKLTNPEILKADLENKLISDIQASIEALYIDGQPLHHLSSAEALYADPNDCQQSSVFVVDYASFMDLSTATLQEIFKSQHILVLNTPQKPQKFSLDSLLKLGPLNKVIQIQGKHKAMCLLLPSQ